MPTPAGKKPLEVEERVVLISAVTKFVATLAATLAGSFGRPVLSVKGR